MKKLPFLFTLGAAVVTGLSACTTAGEPMAQQPASTTQPAQSPMSGMDHGSGSMSPGMDHSSMMNMNLGPKDPYFDLRFIDAMIPHHQGAVEMAQEALTKSQRTEIKQLAQAIIAAQNQEIAEMQNWRKTWYSSQSDTPMMYDEGMGHMMPMTPAMRNSMMMTGDLGAADAEFDLRFLNAMIPHHEGAVVMADQALKNSERAEITTLAQNIITSQQQEIDEMEQWRKAWYGQ